jgi:phosphoribosylanthranilate isomerase
MTKFKVCGMRDSANIAGLLNLQPTYMGFIFYEKSPRHIGEELNADLLKSFPKHIKKVGVFVNAHPDMILKNVKKYSLDLVQLHGNEMPDVCKQLRNRGISIIKAFQLDETFNFNRLNNYKSVCDYFLFDTKSDNFGGTGKAFDWQILSKYDNEKPFFLSGGIDLVHAQVISELKGFNLHAVDINSRFEIEPGLKDVEKIKTFVQLMNKSLQSAA